MLKIYAFPSDKALCAIAALDCYIERSSIWREKNQTSQLFSFIKPHNAVAKFTVAGWVKQILIMSGINTDIFKPHPTRSASSSNARISALSLSDILKRGSWSNKTTWERFYNKPILTFEEKIQKAVVNKESFEERRMGVWAPLLYCHDVGRIQHSIETEIL